MNKNRNNKGKPYASRYTELAFQKRNAEENAYYEAFQACKKSWVKGTIFGVLAGIVCGLLFSGFAFNDIFFGMSVIMSISCTWTFATVFGLKNTADFGCSCVPIWLFETGTAVLGFFAGTYVLVWVAVLLLGIMLFFWAIGFCFFALIFPVETLYYWLCYSVEKKSIRKSMENGLPVMRRTT